MRVFVYVVLFVSTLVACRQERIDKGFSVEESVYSNIEEEDVPESLNIDSLAMKTQPSEVLLTSNDMYRLTTIYKLNFRKRSKTYYAGSNNFYEGYSEIGNSQGNDWNNNFAAGIEVAYGFNMVNVSVNNAIDNSTQLFFEKPVLIKTIYYPAYSKDTLFGKPINRNFYLASAYNKDTNKDGQYNIQDLRRLFAFDINGKNRTMILPKDYSVFKSKYDPTLDRLYVHTRLDSNKNGQIDELEETHIFWVDLKNPLVTGRLY